MLHCIHEIESDYSIFGDQGVKSICVSHDSKLLASGNHDKNIRIWNLENGEEINNTFKHNKTIADLSISKDGNQLISCGSDKNINLWSLYKKQLISSINLKEIKKIYFLDDENQVIFLDTSGGVCLFNLEKKKN